MSSIVFLQELYCHETEDFTGRDDPYMYITVDGKSHGIKWFSSMNNGYSSDIKTSYKCKDSVELNLWEKDDIDSDDYLGTHIINCKSLATSTIGTFNRDGAYYNIYYSVTEDEDEKKRLEQEKQEELRAEQQRQEKLRQAELDIFGDIEEIELLQEALKLEVEDL